MKYESGIFVSMWVQLFMFSIYAAYPFSLDSYLLYLSLSFIGQVLGSWLRLAFSIPTHILIY